MYTYKEAGVDIKELDRSKRKIMEILESTFENRKGIGRPILGMGHYSGIIELGDRAIALSTDGVGTKLLLAERTGKYDTVGIDLIGMLANDLIVNGVEPLAAVDYIACDKPLPDDIMEQISVGLAKGAQEAKISIIGGETAVLPEIVKGFDLAGTVVGVVDKDKIITGASAKPGDVLIGLESSGLHSNGYTLARKVLDLDDKETLEELLTPTRIYVRAVLDIIQQIPVSGLAHITGGAFTKLRRVSRNVGYNMTLPELPGIFKKLKSAGIPDKEMYSVFNCGIGFVIISDKKYADDIIKIADKHGINASRIGTVTKKVDIVVNGVIL